MDDDFRGFEWLDFRDAEASVIFFARYAQDRENFLVFCCNFTPVPRAGYRIGLPRLCGYREVFNSDADMFGGSNMGNGGWVQAEDLASHGPQAARAPRVTLPPLSVVSQVRRASVRVLR